MATLEDNFVLQRGDVIYGFETPRFDIIYNHQTLYNSWQSGAWIVANDFNNNTILRFSEYYTDPNHRLKPGEQIGTILSSVKAKHSQHLDEAKRFIEGLYAKYPPSEIAKMNVDQLRGEGRGGLSSQQQNRMIRRSCKFGIENILNTVNGMVHFVLDGIPDTTSAIDKHDEFGDKVPITVSELRFVFRNWSRLQNRVIFYENLQQIDLSPWTTQEPQWRFYAIGRFTKWMDKLKSDPRSKKIWGKTLKECETFNKQIDKKGIMEIVDKGNEIKAKFG